MTPGFDSAEAQRKLFRNIFVERSLDDSNHDFGFVGRQCAEPSQQVMRRVLRIPFLQVHS